MAEEKKKEMAEEKKKDKKYTPEFMKLFGPDAFVQEEKKAPPRRRGSSRRERAMEAVEAESEKLTEDIERIAREAAAPAPVRTPEEMRRAASIRESVAQKRRDMIAQLLQQGREEAREGRLLGQPVFKPFASAVDSIKDVIFRSTGVEAAPHAGILQERGNPMSKRIPSMQKDITTQARMQALKEAMDKEEEEQRRLTGPSFPITQGSE